jgi:hypothetical protein
MWRPANEAEACSDLAAFLEWLRAMRGWDALDPAELRRWYETHPDEFGLALAEFSPGRPIPAELLFVEFKSARDPKQPSDPDAP